MIKHLFSAALISMIATTTASAESIKFDRNWKKQGFLSFFNNKYDLKGSSVGVSSDETVSLLYRAAPKSVQGATSASWNWSVTESVPPTNLLKKGGDDRNLAIYFVFADKATADGLKRFKASTLVRNPAVRSLTYIWGGNNQTGKVYTSPYGDGRLKMVIKRKAGTGSHSERVDLAADYKRAFGAAPQALIGFAITGDSDDTEAMIKGAISNLKVN